MKHCFTNYIYPLHQCAHGERKVAKKIVSPIMMILLVLSMFTLLSCIQPVRAQGTIYINADGTIDPPTAPISTEDYITYTFTGNITADSILIERNNIVVDGAGYTMQGPGGAEDGIFSTSSNITIKSTNIKNYGFGITLLSSNYNSISGNNITANTYDGIWLGYSSCYNSVIGNNITNDRSGITINHASNYNTISGNNITANNGDGITNSACSNSIISGNNITANTGQGIMLTLLDYPVNNNTVYGNSITANNRCGICLQGSLSNNISGNNIANNLLGGIYLTDSSNYNSVSGNNITANNGYGIWLDSSSGNSVYHNNFIDNTYEVYSSDSTNVWDNGYPSGGNYWSDYATRYPAATEIDNSGLWNTPYVIDANNLDNYPLMQPYGQRYTLTIDIVGSGSVSKNPDQATYTYGTVVTLTATADVGWTFAGWTGDLVSATSPDSITVTGDMTVTATFTQVEIVSVTPSDAVGNPENYFATGTLAYFTVVVENTSPVPANVLITVNIYDSTDVTIGVASFQGPITPGVTTIILGLPIPYAARLGEASVYANAFTNWISRGGVPYGPEISATFGIIT